MARLLNRHDQAHEFVAALHAGRVCLHPTDTLPGLTFDPNSSVGKAMLQRLKGRLDGKPFLGLVATPALARRFFAPLPGNWEELLEELWPGPLSVVWQASERAPRSMVATDGTIGLRVPRLPVEAAWMRAVLEMVDMPLPTTSVNRSGEPSERDYAAAATFVSQTEGCFVSSWRPSTPLAGLASTVLRLHDDGGYTILREGAVSAEHLANLVRAADPVVSSAESPVAALAY